MTSVSVVVVPDRGLTVNHGAFSVAFQASDPAPVFRIFRIWDPELVVPSTTVQLRLDGLTLMAAGGGVRVSVTGILIVESLAMILITAL
jgi:hypothetical protein